MSVDADSQGLCCRGSVLSSCAATSPLLWGKQLEKNSLDLSRRLSLVRIVGIELLSHGRIV